MNSSSSRIYSSSFSGSINSSNSTSSSCTISTSKSSSSSSCRKVLVIVEVGREEHMDQVLGSGKRPITEI